MENELEELIYSKGVVEFIAVANEFCTFVEDLSQNSKEKFVDQSLKLGSLLYFKASTLPLFEKLYEGSAEKFVGEIDWELVNNLVSTKLGQDDLYLDLYLPKNIVLDQAEEISYSEAFADIYQDCKNVTMNYQIGSYEAMNDALWECQTNFELYWGPRILAIMGGLHNLKFNSFMAEEDDNSKQRESKNLRQSFLDFQKPED
jgi:hypothetical protein